MNKKQPDSELGKHPEKVTTSGKVSLEETKATAKNLWNIICNNQCFYHSKKMIVQHHIDGKIVITMYSSKNTSKSSSDVIDPIDEKYEDNWSDFELLEALCYVAENSDVRGKCRLYRTESRKELQLDFK